MSKAYTARVRAKISCVCSDTARLRSCSKYCKGITSSSARAGAALHCSVSPSLFLQIRHPKHARHNFLLKGFHKCRVHHRSASGMTRCWLNVLQFAS